MIRSVLQLQVLPIVMLYVGGNASYSINLSFKKFSSSWNGQSLKKNS